MARDPLWLAGSIPRRHTPRQYRRQANCRTSTAARSVYKTALPFDALPRAGAEDLLGLPDEGPRVNVSRQVIEAPKRLAEYLTPDQVGDMLQLSAKSVYRLAKADPTMPALKIGGSVRFHRERLERWLRDREQGRPQMRRQVLSMAKPASEKETPRE